jgi:hypothetical protein
MNVNVILSFDKDDDRGESQEIFDISLPISKNESDAMSFLNEKFFPRIIKKCKQYNRSPGDLIKISTCSNWSVFENVTGLIALCDLNHDCKWYFGQNRKDIDIWERTLMTRFGFGVDADMSRVNDPEIASLKLKMLLDKLMLEKEKTSSSS